MLRWIEERFGAQPVRVPSERPKPLVLFTRRAGHFGYVGPVVECLLPDARAQLEELEKREVKSGALPDAAGRCSGQLDIDVGLDVLAGLLVGLGVPLAPKIEAELRRASSVAFYFAEPSQRWVNLGALGNVLTGDVLRLDNSTMAPVLARWRGADLFLIDSTIVSRDFSVSAACDSTTAFHLEVDAVAAELARVATKVKVSRAREHDLTFTGDSELCFAFTCVRVGLNERGGVASLSPYGGRVALARPSRSGVRPPSHSLLADEPALLEWDDDG